MTRSEHPPAAVGKGMPESIRNTKCERRESGDLTQRNWLVWFDEHWKEYSPVTRSLVAAYFRPKRIERYKNGLIYRLIGIRFVAYVIPTGGMLWRRLFKWGGWSFALGGNSIRRAREYRYNTCVFEFLHGTGLLLMLPDAVNAIRNGYTDGIIHFLVAGVLINGYPFLLQRYNRTRITSLLDRYAQR